MSVATETIGHPSAWHLLIQRLDSPDLVLMVLAFTVTIVAVSLLITLRQTIADILTAVPRILAAARLRAAWRNAKTKFALNIDPGKRGDGRSGD